MPKRRMINKRSQGWVTAHAATLIDGASIYRPIPVVLARSPHAPDLVEEPNPDRPSVGRPVLVHDQCGGQTRRFAMGAGIALRGDIDGPGLRQLAKATKDAHLFSSTTRLMSWPEPGCRETGS